jgi:hypothetical protein
MFLEVTKGDGGIELGYELALLSKDLDCSVSEISEECVLLASSPR